MATNEENQDETEGKSEELSSAPLTVSDTSETEEVAFDGAPAQLGTAKYVQAAFFAAGVLGAYLTGKIISTIWSLLADWPPAVRAVPQLLRVAEDERSSYTMPVGLVIGVIGVVMAVRRPEVREWADEVATELYKVHWPDREVVTNGTIVVIVAGVFATLYIGLLDRLWGFVTNLVYGA